MTKPLCGTLIKPDGEAKSSCLFRYTPFKGYTGTDYFTFVAGNQVMDSNVGTVSIKVDASLALARLEQEKEKLVLAARLEKEKKATYDMMIKSQIEPSISIRESKGGSSLASMLSLVESGDEEEEDDEDCVKRRTGHADGDSDNDSILGLRPEEETPADLPASPHVDSDEEEMRVTVDLSAEDMGVGVPTSSTESNL